MSFPTASNSLIREPVKEQKQPGITSDFLSASEFPELGAERNLKQGQKNKVKDVAQKEGKFNIFKEAYHAQLREVHGDNVRAVQAMQEDDEELTGRRRNKAINQDTVNNLMEDVIREIAAEGELVTEDKVSRRILFDRPQVAGS